MSEISAIDKVEWCLGIQENVELAYTHEFPPVLPRMVGSEDLPLVPPIQRFLKTRFPEGLFSHQHAALQSVLAGRDTVVTTGTSSGKSLIFSLPVFNASLNDPAATALFIYPQKSLANDQLGKLHEMFFDITGEIADPRMLARYDGATANEDRPGIRDKGRFVLTNPDMMHRALLGHHTLWQRFLAHLRYVIIDESHAYSGIFGSSVAYILRRLQCLCQRYGSRPVFISTSATIHEPREHLRKLTGREFFEVGPDQDGSRQGRKKLWILRSTQHHYQLSRNLTRQFVDRNLSCLTFCPSRTSAENLRLRLSLTDQDETDERIRTYRAGLMPREREGIEEGMKTGRIKGVFSTSALELGIDIGLLDVVLCVGLPNTIMSLWQRMGRVGRGGRDGGIVFVAADRPLDTYFAVNPQELLGRKCEPLVVNLQNRRLVCHHLACARQEAGDYENLDFSVLGPDLKHADELRRSGRLTDGILYADAPHEATPIRNSGERNYRLVCHGATIGEIDPWHLIRETYPHGIYLHDGTPYRVHAISNGSAREIQVARDYTRHITIPRIKKNVYTLRARALTQYGRLTVKKSDFEVVEQLVAIQEKTLGGETVKDWQGPQGLRPHRLPTEGVSIELPLELWEAVEHQGLASSRTAVVHAVERLLRGLFPVVSGPCDVMDYSTFSAVRDHYVAWYLYDQVYDGIDLAIQAYTKVPDLFAKALGQLRSCDCEADGGCFRCIRNPDEEEVASKRDCLRLLEFMVSELSVAEPVEQVFDIDLLEGQKRTVPCPQCGTEVPLGNKFCGECGEKIKES